MTPDGVPADPAHELSSVLFGRALRLPLALWVRGRREPFFQRQAADGLGTHQPYIRKELATFVQTGMVRELPRTDGDIRLFYEPVHEHPWWSIIDAAGAVLHADDPRTLGEHNPQPGGNKQ